MPRLKFTAENKLKKKLKDLSPASSCHQLVQSYQGWCASAFVSHDTGIG